MDIQTSEVTKLNRIISKLKHDLTVKTTEIDELNEKIVALEDLNKKLDDDNRELTNKLIDHDVLQTEMNLNKSYTFDQLNEFQSQIGLLKIENEKLKNDLKKLTKTKSDFENQVFNLNASFSLSSSLSTSSLTQADIQLNELKKINLSLNDQIKELTNYNSILFGEGNRLLNEHNALKETAELMMKECNSLHKEKEILFIQLRDAENNQSISTQKLKTQIIKLKKDLIAIK
jgi:chromosome segregation ATPase